MLERTSSPPPSNRRTLVDRIVRTIRLEITRGTLEPGCHLVEKRLAEDLEVARSTVREALAQLASTGLVEATPGQGHRVRYFSDRDVYEIGEVFAVLEGRAARYAKLPLPRDLERELRRLAGEMGKVRLPDDLDEFIDLDRAFHGMLMQPKCHRKLHEAWLSQEALLGVMLVPLLRRGRAADQARRHLDLVDTAMTGDVDRLAAAIEEHYHVHERPLVAR